ncbi:hypothetical protein LX32DRAFT_133131 [Colletotrichum zoysiae]|uniref:Secreted protein n=1 Tax=Colletotrichum zoysiae TaxID=1216348 RepID=A0AAD9H8T5_9PEZI|nr:hypothetical protein LX32DRAFT_133131 [Colletotrichum zoysiae]
MPWANHQSLFFYGIVWSIRLHSSRASSLVTRLPRPWKPSPSTQRCHIRKPWCIHGPTNRCSTDDGFIYSVRTPSDLAVLVHLPAILVELVTTCHRCLGLWAS